MAILNIKAAGVGLTLTAASAVVFAELVWTPSEVRLACAVGDPQRHTHETAHNQAVGALLKLLCAPCLRAVQVLQAEDRAHRIGQTQSVNIHFLLVKDSIDDLMWELLQNKLSITGQVLDGQATRLEVSRRTAGRTNSMRSKGPGGGEGGEYRTSGAKSMFTLVCLGTCSLIFHVWVSVLGACRLQLYSPVQGVCWLSCLVCQHGVDVSECDLSLNRPWNTQLIAPFCPLPAGGVQVQRSSTQHPKGRGTGSGGPRTGAAAQQAHQQPQQPSITSFFAAGGGDGPASKKARSS